jgi:hypothetical protein
MSSDIVSNKQAAEDCSGNSRNNCNDSADENEFMSGDSFGELAIRETAALERQHWSLGYHETYAESEEAALQEGFENGYRDTYDVATCLGELLGQYAANIGFDSTLPATQHKHRSAEASTIEQSDAERIKRLTFAVSHVKEVLLSITSEPAGVKNSTNMMNDRGSHNEDVVDSSDIDLTVMQQRRQQKCLQIQELQRDVEAVFFS